MSTEHKPKKNISRPVKHFVFTYVYIIQNKYTYRLGIESIYDEKVRANTNSRFGQSEYCSFVCFLF